MIFKIIAVSSFATFLMIQEPAQAGTLVYEQINPELTREERLIKVQVLKHKDTKSQVCNDCTTASIQTNKELIFKGEYADLGSVVLPKKLEERYGR